MSKQFTVSPLASLQYLILNYTPYPWQPSSLSRCLTDFYLRTAANLLLIYISITRRVGCWFFFITIFVESIYKVVKGFGPVKLWVSAAH